MDVFDLPIVYNDRSNKNSRIINQLEQNVESYSQSEQTISENGILFTNKLRHEGQDPLLFLDMRVGREFVKANSHKKSVLNLFSYTCGIGTAAAVGGAKRVVNVDFSSFALAAGKKNAELNNVELSMYDFIMGATMCMEMGMPCNVNELRQGLGWFRKNNAEAYMILLD